MTQTFPWALILYVAVSSAVIWVNKLLLVPGTSVIDLVWYQNLFGVVTLTIMGARIKGPIAPMLHVAGLKLGDIAMNLLVLGAMDVAMSTALRRTSLILTFLGERYVVKKLHSYTAQTGIYITTLGTMVAIAFDRSSTWSAYAYLGLSNIFTTFTSINTSKFLEANPNDALSLQYITSWSALILTSLYVAINGLAVPLTWGIVASAALGLLVNLSTLWALKRHTGLTVSVVGASRSIVLSWCSIVGWLGQDYVFSWPNFVGLQLASAGCLIYMASKAA